MNGQSLFRRILCLILIPVLAVASGCSVNPPSPSVIPSEPAYQPSVEPLPTPEAGGRVVADGQELKLGSLCFDGTAYVSLPDLLDAIGEGKTSSVGKNSLMVEFRGCHYWLFPGSKLALVEGSEISLYAPAMLWEDEVWVPLERLCQIWNISLLKDTADGTLYCTSTMPDGSIPQGIRVPVLMYHAVNSNVWGHRDLFVSPEVMEQHLVYLLENGFDLIHFEDLDHLEQFDKPVILTFDDGYLDNFTNLYPLLEKYDAKATIFVVTSSIGKYETSMIPQQVKQLSDSGLVSIQSHTVSHRVLAGLDAQSQEAELERSRLYVARMTGRQPFVISYPTGAYNNDTLEQAENYYRFAVTVEPGDYVTGSGRYTIPRYNIRHTTTLEELALMVSHAGETVSLNEFQPENEEQDAS